MKERPILFSAPMVRALLDGSKTQTRRVVNQRHLAQIDLSRGGCKANWSKPMPYGQPGDRLWVRESFCRIDGQTRPWIETDYRATYKHGDRLGDTLGIKKRWTPSIHMPRHASRITLEITGVRVERLQDISRGDSLNEGIVKTAGGFGLPAGQHYNAEDPRDSYFSLWESINGPGSVMLNPWVWVVEFKKVTA